MQRHLTWSMLLALLIVLGLVGLAAAQQPRYGGTLRIGYWQDMTGMDPHLSAGIPAVYVMQSIFQTLVTLNEELDIVPELAHAWEVQDSGTTYVFHLQQGVQFHDGTPFDAQAVKWNFDRLLNPEEGVLMRGYFGSVASVEVVDAHTVKVSLKYPDQTLLPALASYALAGVMMVSPTAYQTWGKQDLRLHPVGTGPFKFSTWEQNNVILLERNTHYWKPGVPYLDRVEYKIIKEGMTRATALRRGEVDFANRLPVENIGAVEKAPQIKLFKGPDMALVFTSFNVSRTPFDDLRVRQAVGGYGLDRDELAKAGFLGRAQPLTSMIPPGTRGHVDFPERYPYDPARAQALLKEAGFDARHPLRYTMLTNPFNTTVATIMKSQLARIGVEMTMEVPDHPAFVKRLIAGEFDQQLTQSYPFIDLGERLRLFITKERGGLDFARANDAQADALADHYRQTSEASQLPQRGEELLRYVADNAWTLGLTTIPFFDAVRDNVKGFRFRRHLKVDFETVWLER